MKPPKKLVIPLGDYERIFRVIFSVIDNHARTAHACLFFSIVGSLILKKAYKIDAGRLQTEGYKKAGTQSVDLVQL